MCRDACRFGFLPESSHHVCHDALAHPQTHTGTFGSFCRIERLEQIRHSLRTHTGAIVCNGHFEPGSLLSRIHDIVHPRQMRVPVFSSASMAFAIKLENTCRNSPETPRNIPADRNLVS